MVESAGVQDGMIRQGMRFGGVGLLVTVIHALMQWGWCYGAGVPPWLGYLLALTVSFMLSFTLHYRVTFRSQVPIRTALPAFILLQAAQQTVNYALFLVLCQMIVGGPHAHLAALGLSCAIVTVLSYLTAYRIFGGR